MKKTIFAIVIATILLIQGCGTDEGTSKTSVMLPLYIYPTHWEEDENLTALIEATDGEFVAIISPSKDEKSDSYVAGIDYLYGKNVKMIDYITTDYGERNEQEIYDQIDEYVDFYGTEKVSGIFFDEVSLKTTEEEAYMKDISDYAKSKNLNFIAINPGTTIDQDIFDEKYYDIVLTREGSYTKYSTLTNTVLSSTKTKQSLVVYECPDLSSYTSEIQKAKDQGYNYIYFTIAPETDRYSTVFNFLR